MLFSVMVVMLLLAVGIKMVVLVLCSQLFEMAVHNTNTTILADDVLTMLKNVKWTMSGCL